jgi:hypothetical protein
MYDGGRRKEEVPFLAIQRTSKSTEHPKFFGGFGFIFGEFWKILFWIFLEGVPIFRNFNFNFG